LRKFERGEKNMKKILSIAIVLSLILMGSTLATVFAAPPPISRPMEIIEATIEGGSVATVDPAAGYDTASGAVMLNVYDTLVIFDGEHMDRYLPSLATEWSIKKNDPPIVSAHTGLNFYYTYYFKIRTGVPWQDPAFGTVTPADVEYDIERGMVLEPGDNPQWMFYEPLLNGATMTYINGVDYDPETNMTDRAWVGWAIDEAVQSNSTHVWFNLAFNGAYAPFMQILTQTWSGIYSKAWANSLGRASNWNGDFGADHTAYYAYHLPEVAPFDDPTPAMMGSGPFKLAHLDQTLHYWDVDRFTGYWRGWGNAVGNYGIGWPAFGGSKPAGYIDHFVLTWAYDWNARSTKFLNGEVDFCAVPRQYIGQMLNQPNIRCTYPLPSLACDAYFFQMDIVPTTPYGPVFDYGVLGETGIPRDFFGNATTGLHVRKAFAQCIDFNNYIQTVFLGEAMQPSTCLIPTLPYYDATVAGYKFNLAAATTEFKAVPGLWDTGFTIKILYNIGNLARQTLCESIANNVNSLNTKFHASAVGLDWASYLAASSAKQLPVFAVGWLADYPDAHNFVYPYYYTYGNFAYRAHFSNAQMDDLIDQGIRTPDGPARAAIYKQIQELAVQLCPNVPTATAVGRHFEQSWVAGWYYNAIYPDNYVANMWKWYYTPHAQQDTIPANSTGNLLPYDVNYDGKTNMVDIGTTAASFGSIYGPPMSTKWVYRCDFNNDRKIDMKDIGGVAKNFGKTTTAWTPST
jgi:peptide/nickel transport system substrate-binding protein